MSVRNLKKKSKTDWDRIDRMSEAEIDTSDIPLLDDAFFARAVKVLPRVRIDRLDLIHARKFAAYILARGWSNKKANLAHDAFNIALIVSYVRPFISSQDLNGKREEPLDRRIEAGLVLDKEEIALHNRVRNLRNKYYGHSDADSLLNQGMDYRKDLLSIFKAELNLSTDEVALLTKTIDKWLKHLNSQIALTKAPALLIAPALEK